MSGYLNEVNYSNHDSTSPIPPKKGLLVCGLVEVTQSFAVGLDAFVGWVRNPSAAVDNGIVERQVWVGAPTGVYHVKPHLHGGLTDGEQGFCQGIVLLGEHLFDFTGSLNRVCQHQPWHGHHPQVDDIGRFHGQASPGFENGLIDGEGQCGS